MIPLRIQPSCPRPEAKTCRASCSRDDSDLGQIGVEPDVGMGCGVASQVFEDIGLTGQLNWHLVPEDRKPGAVVRVSSRKSAFLRKARWQQSVAPSFREMQTWLQQPAGASPKAPHLPKAY